MQTTMVYEGIGNPTDATLETMHPGRDRGKTKQNRAVFITPCRSASRAMISASTPHTIILIGVDQEYKALQSDELALNRADVADGNDFMGKSHLIFVTVRSRLKA
jgi:hypothetical protein